MKMSPKAELALACRLVGKQIPYWTQGPGSNISLKQTDLLWIKASGFRLDAVSETSGIACSDFRELARQLKLGQSGAWNVENAEQNYADLIQSTSLGALKSVRPSMETGFHALLPQKWVAHFHSLIALLVYHEFLKDSARVRNWMLEKLGLPISFIEVCRPGWLLSDLLAKQNESAVYILQNHGVVLQCNEDLASLLGLWAEVENEFCQAFNYQRAVAVGIATPMKLYFPDTAVFYERLLGVLTSTQSNGFQLKSNAWTLDKDACELWQATEILYSMCPELGELPLAISSGIANLPTEKFRQMQVSQRQWGTL